MRCLLRLPKWRCAWACPGDSALVGKKQLCGKADQGFLLVATSAVSIVTAVLNLATILLSLAVPASSPPLRIPLPPHRRCVPAEG